MRGLFLVMSKYPQVHKNLLRGKESSSEWGVWDCTFGQDLRTVQSFCMLVYTGGAVGHIAGSQRQCCGKMCCGGVPVPVALRGA